MRTALLVLLLGGCSRAPQQRLAYRESWELLGLALPVGVIDARIAVGNTGLYRNQGTVVLDRFGVDLDSVHYLRRSGPGETERSADGRHLVLSDDLLDGGPTESGGERWRLRVRGEEANAIVEVRGTTGGPVASTVAGGGQWSQEPVLVDGTLHGWLEAGKRGGRLDGRAVVLRRGGDGLVDAPRTTVAVFCDGLSVGVDQHGELGSAWRVPGTGAATGRAWVEADGSGELEVDGVTVRFAPTRSVLRTEVYGHLSAVERVLVGLRGIEAVRTVAQLRTQVTVDGVEQRCPGVLVRVDDDGLEAPARRGKQRRRGAP